LGWHPFGRHLAGTLYGTHEHVAVGEVLHLWGVWTVFASPGDAALAVVFLIFTYVGPGMIKTVLTVRTGNAWVHVWAYYALAPHALIDTPHLVQVFHLR
jgi:hypothetical protein